MFILSNSGSLESEWVGEICTRIERPIHYVALMGSRLFGTATLYSDVDFIAVYQESTADILSLQRPKPIPQERFELDGLSFDLKSYELEHWLRELAKPNGNFTESSTVPDGYYSADYIGVILRAIGRQTITKDLHPFYRGYAFGQLKRASNQINTAKGIAYTFREALTGIYLLRTGEYVYDFYDLCARTQELLSWESRVLPRLTNTRAQVSLSLIDHAWEEFAYLEREMDNSLAISPLPDSCDIRGEMDALLLHARWVQWMNPAAVRGIGDHA